MKVYFVITAAVRQNVYAIWWRIEFMPTKKKRYQYQLRIGTDKEGNAVRKAFYSYISTEDAHRLADEWLKENPIQKEKSNKLMFNDWSEQWMEVYIKPYKKPQTYFTSYVAIYNNHVKDYFEDKALDEIKSIDIPNYFATKVSYSQDILDKIFFFIRGSLNQAEENELILKSPISKKFKPISLSTKKTKKALSDADIERLQYLSLKSHPEVAFLLETGLRAGELAGLKWSDVKGDYIKVERQRTVNPLTKEIVEIPPKDNSKRVVPLSLVAKEILVSICKGTDDYIFHRKNGTAAAANDMSSNVGYFLSTLGPPYDTMSAHELRHTYGTMLRRKGVDIYTIKNILGHTSVDVTARIYVHNEIDTLLKEYKNKVL